MNKGYQMRVALVHDYLNQYGGAERVLECLTEIFPNVPIYTLLYDPAKTNFRFVGKKIFTSFLDFSLVRRHHRIFIPLMPYAAKWINLGENYDLVISATAGYAKGISYGPKTKHLCYCYTPLRYAWEVDNYFANPIYKTFFRPTFNYLKKWDYKVAQKPDKIITLSNYISQKIKSCYGREAEVIYPPLDTKKFFFNSKIKPENYYLAAGRLMHYKNFHIIVEAFNRLGWPLKIVGLGPEFKSLKRMAGPNIEFLSFVTNDDELRQIYAKAKAFIFASIEDFGLVMAEAQACGAPVVALAAGGALEIVKDGENGLFFPSPKVKDLIEALNRFNQAQFDRKLVALSVKKFAKEEFKKRLQKILKMYYNIKI